MWTGYRKFRVDRIVPESDWARSFYLVPADGQPLAPYKPGQHLPFRLHPPDQARPILRFYTLSDCYRPTHYRVTIKKELPPSDRPDLPPGVSSSYFHEHVRVGDVLEAKAPAGDFWLDMEADDPVAFIAGGIGVTPLISMLNAVVERQPQRTVFFFFALRDGSHHVFKKHLQDIAATYANVHLHISYEALRDGEQLDVDCQRRGRIDLDLLQSRLPTLDMPYYICGPGPMMDAIVGRLQAAGIADEQIHTESFGPASTAYREADAPKPATTTEITTDAITVTFNQSGRTLPWDAGYESLLQFAEANDIEISSGCLFGDCATCQTALLEGEVAYNHPTAVTPDPGTCLPCSCKPAGPITLDV